MSTNTKSNKKDREESNEFLLKLENSKILKAIIETLANTIDETELRVDSNGLLIKAMDPSRICLLKLSIKKEDFDEYNCSNECKIVLNLDDLDKILKRSSAKDSIALTYKEEDQKLRVKMKREESYRTRTFSLITLDTDIEEVPLGNLENIEYEAIWGMDPSLLIEAIKDAEIYSEILNIKATENQWLTFNSSGLIGEMVYELEPEDLNETDINEEASGAYSITFLKNILKIASITKDLEISLKTEHPLKMNFTLLEGGELLYFLAPRVESDLDEDDIDYEEV